MPPPLKANEALLNHYLKFCVVEKKSEQRIRIIKNALEWWTNTANKSYKRMNRQDIEDMVYNLEQTKYSEWSKHTFKVVFKTFWRWLKDDPHPPEIRFKIKRPKDKLVKSDLITWDELIEAVNHAPPSYAALFTALYDSNARIGELLCMRIQDVEIHENFIELSYSESKTTAGHKVLTISMPYFLDYWETLKNKKPNAPLWQTYYKQEKKWIPIQYRMVNKTLKRLFTKAGIDKRVYPHLLRHSRTTMLYDNKYNTPTIEKSGGWVKGSLALRRYEHLSQEDYKNEMLERAGIIEEQEDKTPKLQVCYICGVLNSPGRKRCKTCKRSLDPDKALEDRKILKEIQDFMKEVKEHETQKK